MRRITLWLLICALSIPLIIPFIRSGYFTTHDGEWAIIRLTELHRELRDLQFPPRWAGFLNHGYGYPLFLFTYPLPYYVGEVLHLIGFGFTNAIKGVFIISIIGSGVAMFELGKKWWGVWGGLISAVFYLYAPFRLTDLYIRGSIGESLAFVFFPLLFLWGEKAVRKKGFFDSLFFIISLSALILAHNVFAVLFSPVLFGFLLLVVILEKKEIPKRLLFLFLLFIGAFGLAATFWLPALFEKQYTVLASGALTGLSDQFTTLLQLFRFPSSRSVFSLQIGIGHLIGFLLGCSMVGRSKTLSFLRPYFLFFTLCVVVMIFLTLPPSLFLWKSLPVFSSVDFAWRYLGPLQFILSFGAGVLGLMRIKPFAIIIGIWIMVMNSALIQPTGYFQKDDLYYLTNDATTTAFDELMPVWVTQKPRVFTNEKVVIPSHKGTITIEENRATLLSFRAVLADSDLVTINTIYFPGWYATVNNVIVKPTIMPSTGLMQLLLPSGESKVRMYFGQTLIRRIADYITLGTVFILLGLTIITFRKKQLL